MNVKDRPLPEFLLPSCIEEALLGNWLTSRCDYDFLSSESTHIRSRNGTIC